MEKKEAALGSSQIEKEYECLIRPVEDQMIRSVWRIVRDPDETEDAFQEALAKIWLNFSKIRRHPNPRALILRICTNAAYDALRRNARRRWQEPEERLTRLRQHAPSREPNECAKSTNHGHDSRQQRNGPYAADSTRPDRA